MAPYLVKTTHDSMHDLHPLGLYFQVFVSMKKFTHQGSDRCQEDWVAPVNSEVDWVAMLWDQMADDSNLLLKEEALMAGGA